MTPFLHRDIAPLSVFTALVAASGVGWVAVCVVVLVGGPWLGRRFA